MLYPILLFQFFTDNRRKGLSLASLDPAAPLSCAHRFSGLPLPEVSWASLDSVRRASAPSVRVLRVYGARHASGTRMCVRERKYIAEVAEIRNFARKKYEISLGLVQN